MKLVSKVDLDGFNAYYFWYSHNLLALQLVVTSHRHPRWKRDSNHLRSCLQMGWTINWLPTQWYTLPETNSSHLKIGHPKKETGIPTIHFQVRTVSFRESNFTSTESPSLEDYIVRNPETQGSPPRTRRSGRGGISVAMPHSLKKKTGLDGAN